MAKHVKAALFVAIAVFIPAAFVAEAVFATAGVAFAQTAIGMAAMAFGTTLITSLIGGMTSKGINATGGNFGTKFAARGATAPRQLIYGKCRVGGTIVHLETTGTDNYLLHMVVVLAGHEIDSLESVRLNDTTLTTSSSTINSTTVFTVTNSEFSNTDNENKLDSNGRLVRFCFEDGSQTTANAYAVAQSSLISTDKFLDCAYVYMQMVFDPEKFGGGMPNISFVVKGKKVYDPRSGETAWTDSGGKPIGTNPALCIRDYLTDTTYGLKALSTEINDTTNLGGVAAAANACEVDVTLADGSTTEDKYTANGFTNFSASGTGVLEGLLSSMAGKLSYTNGQFNIFAGTTQTPSLTITDDNLLAPVQITTNANTGELYNTVKPIYVDSTNNFIAADAPVYQDSTFLTEDTPNGVTNDKPNYVKQMEKQLPFTVTHTMAQRIGRLALNNQRFNTTISCLVDMSFMKLQPADWVYVTNERLSFNQKVFEVISVNMEVMQSDENPMLGVRLNLKEADNSIFAFATSDYQTPIVAGSDLPTGAFTLSPPTSLSVATDSTTVDQFSTTSVTATWSNAASPFIIGTEVQYKKSSASVYTTSFAAQGATKQVIPALEIGVAYNFRVRHLSMTGGSAYTSIVNHTVSGTANTLASVLNANATGIKTFLQNDVPTSVNAGDLWIDSNDGNKIYRATSSGNTAVASGQWVLTTITAGAIGLGNVLNQAQVTTFASDNPPTSTAVGDLWIDTNDGNKIYRAQSAGADQVTSGEWVLTTLTKAGIGLGNVADERQITIFREDNPPTATAVGDLWYDTNDNNRQYRASATGSSNWVEVSPNKSTVGLDNVANERQITIFRQDNAPTATAVGDLWYDTNDNNRQYRASATGSSNWVEVSPNKSTVGLSNLANERQVTIFRQTSVPTALAAGDLWVDTDDGNKLYRATAAGNNSVTTNQWVLVNVTKAGIGLANVDNKSSATILGEEHTGLLSGDLKSGSETRTTAQMIDGRDRSVTGLNASGVVQVAVPSAQISGALTTVLTASPSNSAQWTTNDGAIYSPTGTNFDITVTADNGISSETCVIRWSYENVDNSNNDYISACTEFTDSSNAFTLGSITDLSGNDVKYATCIVTHTASSTPITLQALLSQLHVSGGGK